MGLYNHWAKAQGMLTIIKNKNLEMKRTIEKIASLATIVEPVEKLAIVKDDPDDNKVLECAKAGKVDLIVSSDNHLLELKEFEKNKDSHPKKIP